MKKVLSILSTLTLASSATLVLVSTVDNHIQQTKTESTTNINWNDVKKSNDDYFKNFKINQKDLSRFTITKSDEMTLYAKNKANDYIEMFQNKNFNLDQMIEYLSTENLEFRNNYNKILQEQNNFINQQLKQAKDTNILDVKVLDAQQDFATLDAHVRDLSIAKATITTMAATAAVAAAAFWAAAWFFGISVPWATDCTAISIFLGGIVAGLNIAIELYDKTLNNLDKMFLSGEAVINLGAMFGRIAWKVLVTATTTATALSWAFPAVMALIPIFSATMEWIKLYK